MALSQRFQWRGRTVGWDVRGRGPAVVFCHGTPWSSRLWEPYAHALSTEFTVYLWDMPGYGASSKHADHPVDLAVQGELFADLLAHWELREPHVVAHDYGGAVSLRAHLLHRAMYGSLALVDVVALRPWGSDFFKLVTANADTFTALPPAVHRGALEAYIRGASHRGPTDEQLATLTEPWLTAEGQAAFYRQIAQADERFTDEFHDLLPTITMPTHVIWGDRDTWIPPDRGRQLVDLIPGAHLEIIENAGHLVQYDAPVALAVALHRWLSRTR